MDDRVGKCLCGAIEVTCEQAPENIAACYCLNCQKATGGANSYNIVMPESSIRVSKGETSVYHDSTDSGNAIERHFCNKCGSPVYSKGEGFVGKLVLKAGLFSHVKGMVMRANIWTDSAPEWASLNNDVTSFGKGR